MSFISYAQNSEDVMFWRALKHAELLNPLSYPPNVFDGFIWWEQVNSEWRSRHAEAKAQKAEEASRLMGNQA